MFRFTIRDALWFTVFLALGVAWFYCSWTPWSEKPAVKYDTRPPDEAISEYRQLLNNLN
jgi:hypothetical protein